MLGQVKGFGHRSYFEHQQRQQAETTADQLCKGIQGIELWQNLPSFTPALTRQQSNAMARRVSNAERYTGRRKSSEAVTEAEISRHYNCNNTSTASAAAAAGATPQHSAFDAASLQGSSDRLPDVHRSSEIPSSSSATDRPSPANSSGMPSSLTR